ncbi:MAG: ABC transporter permease [Chloroflexi bacterium]|nr:ABC transporter permease [Chloroflexota bacterium]
MKQRLASLIRKEFIQIIRDPRTLVLTLIYPIAMLFLLGYAITNDVRNIPLAVLDRDHTSQSRALLDAYRASDYFTLEYYITSEDEMNYLIESNQARAAIIIPPGYGRDIVAGRVGTVAFIIDGSDPNVAGTALTTAIMVGQSQATKLMASRTMKPVQSQLHIDVRTQVWYNPGMITAYYMIPALIGMILQFLTTFLTSTSIVRERERGTIEQLIVTPIRSWELVAGKMLPYVLIAFFDMIEILVAGVLLFNVPINGSLLLLLVLSCLFLITTLGIGLLISTVANTQQEAMLTTMFTLLPSIFLSGFMFPLAAMPTFLQVISYAIPLRYFLIIARGIVLKGTGAEVLIPEILALCFFALLVMAATALRFRKQLDLPCRNHYLSLNTFPARLAKSKR